MQLIVKILVLLDILVFLNCCNLVFSNPNGFNNMKLKVEPVKIFSYLEFQILLGKCFT